MNMKWIFIVVIGILLFPAVSVRARVSEMTVAVDGMACPFCAFGVEKRLKKVAGAGSVVVDMKSGRAHIAAGPERSIHFQEVPKAIREAGFTAGLMKITVSGIVERGGASSFVLTFDGSSLRIGGEKPPALIQGLAGSGKRVAIQGILNRRNADDWSVTPETVEEVTP